MARNARRWSETDPGGSMRRSMRQGSKKSDIGCGLVVKRCDKRYSILSDKRQKLKKLKLGAKIMALKTVSSCFIWFTMWKKWSWSHEPWNFGLSNFQTKQYFNARNQAGWISISKQSPKTSVHIGGNTTYTNHSQWMSMAFFNTLLRSRMALKPVAIMTRCFTRCFTTLLEHWTNAHRSSLLHGSQCHFAAGWWTRPGRPWSWSWGLGG